MRKLFKGGNYSRAETIRRNTVFQVSIYVFHEPISFPEQLIEKLEIKKKKYPHSKVDITKSGLNVFNFQILINKIAQ